MCRLLSTFDFGIEKLSYIEIERVLLLTNDPLTVRYPWTVAATVWYTFNLCLSSLIYIIKSEHSICPNSCDLRCYDTHTILNNFCVYCMIGLKFGGVLDLLRLLHTCFCLLHTYICTKLVSPFLIIFNVLRVWITEIGRWDIYIFILLYI